RPHQDTVHGVPPDPSCDRRRARHRFAALGVLLPRHLPARPLELIPHGGDPMATTVRANTLAETPLLPPGFAVPASRWTDPATRLRALLDSEPYVFAPGIYDPHGAEIAMYHRATAIY